MVFLIQNSQNRDAAAIQVKLDELIRVSKAQNSFIGLEHLTRAGSGYQLHLASGVHGYDICYSPVVLAQLLGFSIRLD
jgi:hypothetical protein